ncbi:unnamed protein product [Mucor hiemalis]
MILHIPNLLEGKTLTGVLPPEKQPPLQYFLPQHHHPQLLDIEACIDYPSLAPLGNHVQATTTKETLGVQINERRKTRTSSIETGQVKIQPKAKKESTSSLLVNRNGIAMLRRRGLESNALALELDLLLSPPPYLKLTHLTTTPDIHYSNLIELDISKNRLSQLPIQIQQLVHLRILNVTSNQLNEIPKVLYALKELQVLNLSQNQIKVIPEEMPSQLPNLITLRIAANLIDTLPSCLHDWKKMRQLQLGSVYGGNRLVQLPDTLSEMSCLQELDVSYNQLTSLPTNLEIPSLLSLNISHNQLDFVPKSIARCHQLKSLNVSKNHLTSLPADLVNLRNLELFDISENLLCILPAEILERMQDATLLITGNPLTRPGHCDQRQDAYTKIIRQMTLRGLTRSSPAVSSPRDQCGPTGMGCLQPTSTASSSASASGSGSSSSSHQPQQLPSPPVSPSEASTPTTSIPSTGFPFPNYLHDEDATIDQELSYHAQQLNIDGSRPSTPPPPPSSTSDADSQLIGTFRSKIVQDSTASSSQYILVDFPRQLPLPTETKLLHSLKEIATRTILKHDIEVPSNWLAPHLEADIMGGKSKCRACSYCQGPFVHEWVTSVQVKSFGGHPAVVRRVRFCSTACWTQNLPKEQSKSVICVHK